MNMPAYTRFNEQNKGPSLLSIITWSVLGKQNVQAEKVYCPPLSTLLCMSVRTDRSLHEVFMSVSMVTTAAAAWDWIPGLSWSLLNPMLTMCWKSLPIPAINIVQHHSTKSNVSWSRALSSCEEIPTWMRFELKPGFLSWLLRNCLNYCHLRWSPTLVYRTTNTSSILAIAEPSVS